jgi:hypothetical protein
MDLLGCAPGSGSLCGVALDDAQLCHGEGEIRKAGEKVAGSRSRRLADNSQGPGNVTEPAPNCCPVRDAAGR